jgi:hypothetical protein
VIIWQWLAASDDKEKGYDITNMKKNDVTVQRSDDWYSVMTLLVCN